jgi:tetratricopeptide (TPR) repeat protein
MILSGSRSLPPSPAVRRLAGLALLALSLLATQVAAAEPSKRSAKADARASAKVEVQKAQVDYELGRFDRALERYTRAYELYPVPALLFNLGQCHRNLKNPEHAIFFFEGYLREETNLGRSRRALTEDLIAESKAVLARQEVAAETAATAAVTARTAPPWDARPPEIAPPPPAPPLLIDRGRDRSPRRTSVVRKWWFWTTVGVAAAAGVYYATGAPRWVAPSGSVGTIDRR